jgi:hypothetical protein
VGDVAGRIAARLALMREIAELRELEQRLAAMGVKGESLEQWQARVETRLRTARQCGVCGIGEGEPMYSGDVKWTDLAASASAGAETLKNALIHGLDLYNEWQNFRAGRTNAQIATDLGAPATETRIAELDAAFAAMKELHDCANNVAVTTSDRFYSLRKFS